MLKAWDLIARALLMGTAPYVARVIVAELKEIYTGGCKNVRDCRS